MMLRRFAGCVEASGSLEQHARNFVVLTLLLVLRALSLLGSLGDGRTYEMSSGFLCGTEDNIRLSPAIGSTAVSLPSSFVKVDILEWNSRCVSVRPHFIPYYDRFNSSRLVPLPTVVCNMHIIEVLFTMHFCGTKS